MYEIATSCVVVSSVCHQAHSVKCFTGIMGDNRFRLEEEELGCKSQDFALRELRESPETVARSLQELRRIIREDEKLYFRDDDNMLMIFLRPCKFYPESAYNLMKRVSDFKEKNAELLSNLTSVSEKDALLYSNVVNVLVDRDQHGRRILIANVGGLWDTKKVDADHLFRLFYLVHLAAMLEPETQVRGVVVILDFDKLSMKQVMAMSPTFSMRLLTFIQEAMPLRLKEVHIVKQPFLFNVVWSMFKPFIQEKLRNRLFFHGSKMSSLHKHLDPAFMPEDYGGTKPKINYSSAEWFPVLSAVDNHLKEWSTYGNVKTPKV
uniref:CRAL-TRIO domain-containing protein n=2 Tax=Clastoptera arizonana TaxID=38151 RepID=A0A1B6DTK8_9HEMI